MITRPKQRDIKELSPKEFNEVIKFNDGIEINSGELSVSVSISENDLAISVNGEAKLKIKQDGSIVPSTNESSLGTSGAFYSQGYFSNGINIKTPDGNNTFRISIDNDGNIITKLI